MSNMSSENPYASPMSDDPPVVARPRTPGVWRHLDHIVASRGATFPDRCVKCNRPTHDRGVRYTLVWQPWWMYLLAPTCLPYLMIAVLLRRSIVVQLRVCLRHRIQRWIPLALLVILLFSASRPVLLAICVGLILSKVDTMWFLRATWIDGDIAWVKGTCKEFRESLPEWPGE